MERTTRIVVALAAALGLVLAVFLARSRPGYFASVTYLGGFLFLQFLVISVWHYRKLFFFFLMTSFFFAGMAVPFQGMWTQARWLVLAVGAAVGYVLWMKSAENHFGVFRVIAFFCVCSAFVSAMVSQFAEISFYKCLSLALLFLYASSGARVAVLDREKGFIDSLLVATELLTAAAAIATFAAGYALLGNPNSLGAVMGVLSVPILFWGTLVAETRLIRARRGTLLLLALIMLYSSRSRAGILGSALAVFIVCFALRRHRLLAKITLAALCTLGAFGVAAPGSLKMFSDSFTQDVLFKGHQEAGLLGSRRSPWQKTVESIQASPWFGTGYGTSPSGEDPGLYLGKFSSTVEVRREHGTSYLEILEWVGLLGILPFVALLGYLGGKIGVTLWRLRISGDITHPSIPLILVLMSGAMHAGLEDWLFAVGYYLSVAFWVLAFVFVDLAPGAPVPERNGATWVPDVPRSFTGVAPMPQ